MHSDEPLFRDLHGKVVGSGRVMPTADGRIRILLAIVFSNDYGRCSATRHRGDPERVAIDLEIVDPNTTRVVGTFTASHEGTGLDAPVRCHGQRLDGIEGDGGDQRRERDEDGADGGRDQHGARQHRGEFRRLGRAVGLGGKPPGGVIARTAVWCVGAGSTDAGSSGGWL